MASNQHGPQAGCARHASALDDNLMRSGTQIVDDQMGSAAHEPSHAPARDVTPCLPASAERGKTPAFEADEPGPIEDHTGMLSNGDGGGHRAQAWETLGRDGPAPRRGANADGGHGNPGPGDHWGRANRKNAPHALCGPPRAQRTRREQLLARTEYGQPLRPLKAPEQSQRQKPRACEPPPRPGHRPSNCQASR